MSSSEAESDLQGHRYGGYWFKRLLGEGGFGAVWELENKLGRRCAAKVLRRELLDNADIVRRFMREAETAAKISHPNIVEVQDVTTLPDGRPIIVMEYLEGETLSAYLEQQGPLQPSQAAPILLEICAALAAAHAMGVVHRDLKPDNIFFHQLAGRPRVLKVLDFGIARIVDNKGAVSHHTRTGQVMGTPAYMSPEQVLGQPDIDLRTDVYALGVVTYKMFTGGYPYHAHSVTQWAIAHASLLPLLLHDARPDLAQAWSDIVAIALSKFRDSRFPSMLAFGDAVRAAADGRPVHAPQGPPPSSSMTPTLRDGPFMAAMESVPSAMPLVSSGRVEQPRMPLPASGPLPVAGSPQAPLPHGRGFAEGAAAQPYMQPYPSPSQPHPSPSQPHSSPSQPSPSPAEQAQRWPEQEHRAASAPLQDPAQTRESSPHGPASSRRSILIALGVVAAVGATIALVVALSGPPAASGVEARAVTKLEPTEPAKPATTPAKPATTPAKPATTPAKPAPTEPAKPTNQAPDEDQPNAAPSKPPSPPSQPAASSAARRAATPPQATPRQVASAKPESDRAPAAGSGTLTLSVTPWAEVYINGKNSGFAPMTLKLPTGRYSLLLVNPTQNRRERLRVDVTPGKPVVVKRSW